MTMIKQTVDLIKDIEQIIRSLLHEHTHSRQNKKVFDKGYEDGKTYQNHPYEKAATAVRPRIIKAK